ncbi:class I SAM-dependent methyltransferase [Methanobrevibacter sp. OttesenSCG-928-K11]|nr:class I SAM-dependent methyltransferase [Methanobrevibacter sp. OttesenSCG-928-K11]MDL2270389.1 class I SAM-dependent methyltransferase [Methanobrevibacter sp. OttesenSCG-928-I08]
MKDFILKHSGSYNFYKNNYEKLLHENTELNKRIKQYEAVYPPKECPICGYEGIDFKPYDNIIHKEVECPNCKSHERHRALWLYFHENKDILKKGNTFLHFAPEIQFNEMFRNSGMEYHPVDISSENSLIEEIIDIQDIPYEDNYFDLIYCSNVLEHVPDDNKAMNELYRVLKPGGLALILVPINGISYEMDCDKSKTFEDEKYNTSELRDKYYGQFDHLRLYGTDFKSKLENVGFNVIADDYIKNLGHEVIDKYALIKDENIFECVK